MNEYEKKTIEAFMVKEKRERWESFLGNPKRRQEILGRLDHLHLDLDEKYATWLPTNALIEQMLRQAGSPENVYVLSSTKELDGKMMSLADAIGQAENSGLGTLISCVPGQLAYYYGEAGRSRAILKRKP